MKTTAYERGATECALDRCENVPFSGIGGLEQRHDPKAPDYIPEEQKAEFIRGYIHAAQKLYGKNWQTCEFIWKPAILINDDEDDE